jgi:hypothetical protein
MRRSMLMLLALTVFTASSASAATVSKNFNQTGKVNLKVTPSGCENNPGPYITIDGAMTLSGAKARLIFSNNERLTHSNSADVKVDVELTPVDGEFRIAKQPSRGGVGGNPWIYFQFTSPSGAALTSPVKLGRCVQGLTNAGGLFAIPTGAQMNVTSGNCSGAGGPFVTLDGALRIGGLNGRVILSNNAKWTHAAAEDVILDLVLLEDGQSITFAKQPPLDGVTGNPIIYLQFLTGAGAEIGAPIKLGRCNQL